MAGKTPGAKMLHLDDEQQQQQQQAQQQENQQQNPPANPPAHPHQLQQLQREQQHDDESPKPPGPTGSQFDAVTPGIHLRTYVDSDRDSQDSDFSSANSDAEGDGDKPVKTQPEGYFCSAPADQQSRRESQSSRRRRRRSQRMTTANSNVDNANGTGESQTEARPKMRRRESLSEIRAANPDLALSGNIISATFSTPHSFKYRKGGEWDLKPRRGQSALLDSFAFLSSTATPWNHTVVAWTGEIEAPVDDVLSTPGTPANTTLGISSLNALSAPVPVDATTRLPTPPPIDGLWVPKADQDRLEYQLSHNKTIKTFPVWLADENEASEEGILLKDQTRWRRYAEYDLYTLFHYKQHEPSDGRKERVEWADYYRMNQKFANKIIEIYKPGDIVIVHDYFLMLLPSMLRQRIPNMYISFFLHSPFPSSEFLRCLPRRKEVLEGVLGANLIGFQSYSYSRHFLSCCTRILGFPSDTLGIDAYGTRVQVGVYPIGIDAAKVENFAWTAAVNEKYDALKKMYQGKKIIVGRDRLDSVRGVAQKLQAFERFLEMYPEWREKVVLIQVTSPTSVEAEKEDPDNKVATRVNELVMGINGMYGSLGFSPVQHYPQYLNQDEYFALLRAGDIGLITSVRDGMNTTSLEYIVCQRQGHGPLILSEFSGTAGSLSDAIHINPWDLSGVAEKINAALTMSDEKRQAMQDSLYQHVTEHNVQSWTTKFIRKVYNVLGDGTTNVTPLLDRALLLSQYRSAEKRLFMFDYDGTLTPIVREPSAAVPSGRLMHTLEILAADPRNAVWIISGRDQDFLKQHLGHIPNLGFSAEHGSFMKHPGSDEWENLAEKFPMGWQSEVMEIFQKYTDKVPGSFIERKRCALTWHYRLANPEQGIHMSRECHKELESTVGSKWDVEVMPGKANVEVRPTFINKGEIAKRLITTYHNPHAIPSASNPNPGKLEFALCMGDDFTDEDMFRSLNGASGNILDANHIFTVTVGASTKVTLAKSHLLEPEDVIECVALLAGLDGERLGDVNLGALSTVEGHIPAEKL
ncbi:Fc.00g011520.m01.CDS01 [Cosmosporella sp. VM-42]